MNFSTTSSDSSTSCSNSIADSAMTSSAAKIGAPERTARAIASLGRESISSSRPFTDRVIEAKNVFSRSSVTDTWVHLASSSPSTSHEQVVGHRPRGAGALELHQDRGGLGMADPDRQELVAVGGLQQHDRLLADHVEADAVDDHLLHRESSEGGRFRV